MKFTVFERNKIRRHINTFGADYTFYRHSLDKFKEPIPGGGGEVATLKGVFHQSSSYETLTTQDGSTTHSKPSPMILCLFEDAKYLQPKDFLRINEKKYEVTGVINFGELNYAADICLQEIQHG